MMSAIIKKGYLLRIENKQFKSGPETYVAVEDFDINQVTDELKRVEENLVPAGQLKASVFVDELLRRGCIKPKTTH